ncbi:YybH family protein [Glycomyces paridis]|uniref:DUF4440 domain-containing protein n=1 Tax=Glycomyces paridis TaxID=2126555 RepID=A0A4S8PJF1_9ACTN|nr:nuclear transport factor 2 family protein [Glycomyces paridis]THV30807.1 DUF4440 domain-containing protein [Glycomyces paridis]
MSENAVRDVVGAIVEGLRARDLEALRRVYAEDMVSFDVEAPLRHVGVEAKLRNWANVFAVFAEVDYEVRDLELAVDGALAFGYGFGRLSGTLGDGTATAGMWVRVTFCFKRIGESWRIVHDQVSVPLDLRTGAGVRDLEP